MKPAKRPTDVSLVLEALVACDDFMNRSMLAQATQLPRDRLMLAIAHLIHYRAAEAVAVGQELWYMATPQSDTRIRVLKEIKEGITRKRSRKTKPAPENKAQAKPDKATALNG